MEQLCTSCSYPENECNTCPVIENYLTSLPQDCTILHDLKTEEPLRQLILELKEEVHALTLEIEELKRSR